MSASCYHCNSPIPDGSRYSAIVAGTERAMCCPGCAAVARLIDEHGLSRFYDFRTSPSLRAGDSDPGAFAACDRPEVRSSIVELDDDDGRRARLRCRVEGMNCAACTWLINKALRDIEGIGDVGINALNGLVTVTFDASATQPSRILEAMARFGFTVRPLPRGAAATAPTSDTGALRRLAVAGLGFAQVMTLSAALYLGDFKAMTPRFESFLTLASLLIATPVVLYAGQPIFRNALRDLSARHVGMDLPVGLAVAAALGASIFNALRGTGPVFFDSATMFIFFLTLGRFLESRARYRAGRAYASVDELVPLSATRVRDAVTETVGTVELVTGDIVIVPPGARAPADGVILSERASVDESLLSGETTARSRLRSEVMLGGSLNVGANPVELRVTAVGRDSYAGHVDRLLETALARKPHAIRAAEAWASRIATTLLVVTAIVGCCWLVFAPHEAFEVVLAMLVVTCPCAISLAAPAAFAAGLGALARHGLLLRSTEVIEQILDVRTWLFDKTGTVTEGAVRIARTWPMADLDVQRCIEIAAALEAGIDHPIARAFTGRGSTARAHDVAYYPGKGVTGHVGERRFRLGSAAFVAAPGNDVGDGIWLADDRGVVAHFEIRDTLRPHAREAIAMLTAAGAEVRLVSGDGAAAVAEAARELGIDAYRAAQLPEQKLAALQELQAIDNVAVAAVGDGINDAPLLAQADVSIAMVSGSELARASADIVFTGADLRCIAMLPGWAARVRRTIRQNIAWAVAYNVVGIPAAAAGIVPPWLAALGMSMSSLVVVLNGLRLSSARPAATQLHDEREHTSRHWQPEAS
jgi:Cu2+-exporting ATPase